MSQRAYKTFFKLSSIGFYQAEKSASLGRLFHSIFRNPFQSYFFDEMIGTFEWATNANIFLIAWKNNSTDCLHSVNEIWMIIFQNIFSWIQHQFFRLHIEPIIWESIFVKIWTIVTRQTTMTKTIICKNCIFLEACTPLYKSCGKVVKKKDIFIFVLH